ncbi:superoxide dismutase [Cu-Zn]-like [Lytechinus pictus]|uniref:superoxide dismutase [Cu-Zn]-like n=1 Tax=Lytechinus pictus TaxID=7653 RepID=UPI0030B9C1D9
MQYLLAFLSLTAVITSCYCVRIPLFSTLRHLQHEIDNLKGEVFLLRQAQEQCHPTDDHQDGKNTDATVTVNFASCRLTKNENGEIVGRVDLREQEGSSKVLQIRLQVDGAKLPLEANSKHGFHVHAYGNISGSCSNTGGHYNPEGVLHGGPTSTQRHTGDLGNVQADASGNINVSFNDTHASLTGDNAIIGRAFVLHAGEDDLGTGGDAGSRATGNAGSRLACCVIGWASGTDWTN